MTPGCGVTFAGTCTSLTQSRAFMVITLGTAAIVMYHQWWLEVRADG